MVHLRPKAQQINTKNSERPNFFASFSPYIHDSRFEYHQKSAVRPTEMVIAMKNPKGRLSIPLMRFIPKKLATSVGTIMNNVMMVRVFITVDILLLMMLA